MSELRLKPNPFLCEIVSFLKGLGLNVDQAKQVVPNAVLFNFKFNDIMVYICIPNALPSSYSNIARIEVVVADLPEDEAAQLTVSIASYLQIENCWPVRVTTKRSKGKRAKGKRAKVLIEFVSDLQLLMPGALATILLHCCELADQLRNELVIEGQEQAA